MNVTNAGVSVIICCHNSGKRLPETLRHLAEQVVEEGIPWEVVIVDNASTDDTQAVVREHWSHPAVELRVVSEPQAGLSHARQRGVDSSQYEILSFIDDDNWVDPFWILRVSKFFALHPEAAAVGGATSPVIEGHPPEWFHPVSLFYAVGEQHKWSGDITDEPGSLLWGAGMTLRKSAYNRLIHDGFEFACTGRRGRRLTAGEDAELCMALKASGWRLHYDPLLKLEHLIPMARLKWSYARRLMCGIGRSSAVLNAYRIATSRIKPMAFTWVWWKESWLLQTLKALRTLILTILHCPMDILRGAEGNLKVLQFDRELGVLLGYGDLVLGHRTLIGRLRDARWNRSINASEKSKS